PENIHFLRIFMVAITRFSSVVGLASAIALQSTSSPQTASLESWGEVAGRKESGGQVPGKKLTDSDEIPEEVGSDEIPEEVGSDEIPEEVGSDEIPEEVGSDE
ncbi:hypothetical protein FOZ63_005179, partial [Perkinsus olseni]